MIKKIERKFVLLFVVGFIFVVSVLFYVFIYQAYKKKESPRILSSLLIFEDSPIRKIDTTEVNYNELRCQIFLKDVYYEQVKIADFTIFSFAPCWFYLSDKTPNFVNVPLLITNDHEKTYVAIDSNIPSEEVFEINDETAKYITDNIFFNSNENNYNQSIIAKINFTNKKFLNLGEKSKATFLIPLLNAVDQNTQIENFEKNLQWPKGNFNFLIYNYSSLEPIK